MEKFYHYDAVGKSFSIFLPIPFRVYRDGDLVRADFYG